MSSKKSCIIYGLFLSIAYIFVVEVVFLVNLFDGESIVVSLVSGEYRGWDYWTFAILGEIIPAIVIFVKTIDLENELVAKIIFLPILYVILAVIFSLVVFFVIMVIAGLSQMSIGEAIILLLLCSIVGGPVIYVIVVVVDG